MAALNKTILTGRLTRDPEVRYTTDEIPVTNFTLAVDRVPHNGEKQTDFINIVAWNHLAKICGEHLKKGRLVAVEGRLQIRSYESKEGSKRKIAEVIANGMQILDWRTSKKEEK